MAFVVLEHIERHIRAGGALGPDLAVKVGQAFRRFAVDADDNVAAPQPGFPICNRSRLNRRIAPARPIQAQHKPTRRPALYLPAASVSIEETLESAHP